jgi:hypothetical protein
VVTAACGHGNRILDEPGLCQKEGALLHVMKFGSMMFETHLNNEESYNELPLNDVRKTYE